MLKRDHLYFSGYDFELNIYPWKLLQSHAIFALSSPTLTHNRLALIKIFNSTKLSRFMTMSITVDNITFLHSFM